MAGRRRVVGSTIGIKRCRNNVGLATEMIVNLQAELDLVVQAIAAGRSRKPVAQPTTHKPQRARTSEFAARSATMSESHLDRRPHLVWHLVSPTE
jgi:hypothetical protein